MLNVCSKDWLYTELYRTDVDTFAKKIQLEIGFHPRSHKCHSEDFREKNFAMKVPILTYACVISNQVSKIVEKAVCRSVFLTIWHRILGAELTKTHSFRLLFLAIFPTGK